MKTSPSSEKTKIDKGKSALQENIEAIVIAVLLALFIRTFVVQAFKIPSGSMKETLKIGDQILVNKFIYGVKLPFFNKTLIPLKNPQKNDVLVFRYPKDTSMDYIKRVVAVGGDVVKIQKKRLFVNDREIINGFVQFTDFSIEPASKSYRDYYGPIKVPEGKLFVMGDNRDESSDSRSWGFVDLKDVKGKAFIIYWSWDKTRFSLKNGRLGVRWNRLGHLIK